MIKSSVKTLQSILSSPRPHGPRHAPNETTFIAAFERFSFGPLSVCNKTSGATDHREPKIANPRTVKWGLCFIRHLVRQVTYKTGSPLDCPRTSRYLTPDDHSLHLFCTTTPGLFKKDAQKQQRNWFYFLDKAVDKVKYAWNN